MRFTMNKKERLAHLDETMSNKLIKLSRKYPQFCAQYLIEMHKAIDWGKKQLKEIKK